MPLPPPRDLVALTDRSSLRQTATDRLLHPSGGYMAQCRVLRPAGSLRLWTFGGLWRGRRVWPDDLTPTSNLNAAQASLPGWPNSRLHRRFSNGLLAVEPHHAQLNRITRATLLSAAPAPAPSEKPHRPAQASEQKATFICYATP
ncbi:hypothetical protein FA95DRAFT_1566460 [Auriscalpium vulgare]|uniref:Uncharacterized protein n=1 Tax=Auriscalpium vulgare TaxID=40419 RepID=A0ACB8R9X3_9AGAM|nr:hypothetical protein FA95DRAFT_1566460 [Auriscalpium vulgare]